MFYPHQTAFCESGSVVERCLAKADIAGPNPVSRSTKYPNIQFGYFFALISSKRLPEFLFYAKIVLCFFNRTRSGLCCARLLSAIGATEPAITLWRNWA